MEYLCARFIPEKFRPISLMTSDESMIPGILLRSMLSKKIQMIVSEERSDEGNNHLTMMLSETKHHPAIMNPWCLNRRFMMKL